jgi:hypothetical protein
MNERKESESPCSVNGLGQGTTLCQNPQGEKERPGGVEAKRAERRGFRSALSAKNFGGDDKRRHRRPSPQNRLFSDCSHSLQRKAPRGRLEKACITVLTRSPITARLIGVRANRDG